ncbi:dinucleotide-binding protein [Lentzea pudingi]|uniref:Dinucleotide-binding protein n=1 Tax=Lentzea pudingi TaxID=1789439 RepID=A0ABQ2ISM0_9PSEU|nr:NAD(P)-binding domain-containing protein [Lentzea pudingi]GGN23593.1 dinucleotide-binding protein [Lentzea pudingi]
MTIPVTIFGSGAMGTAIGDLLTAGGAIARHIGRDDTAELAGEIVVLAVPYEALDEITGRYRDQLAGRVVVDITNPLDFETFEQLKVPAGSSAAAELQKSLPDARVLKAFNTTFAATLTSGKVGENPVTVLLAGDDHSAKQALSDLIVAGGLAVVDSGQLDRAHELEALGFLQLRLANDGIVDWSNGFALVR